MNIGYIRLHRRIRDKAFYYKPNYLRIWLEILLKANHKDTEVLWNGVIVKLKAGQLITGRKVLSKKLKIAESTTEDILRWFETQHQIRQQKCNKYRIISVLNWDRYQATDKYPTTKATSSRQQADTDNNVKNEKKIYKLSAELKDLTDFFIRKIKAKRYYSYEISGRDIRVCKIALSKRKPEEIKEIINWYFTIDKSKEHCSLASALSQHSLNLYEENSAKGNWNKI